MSWATENKFVAGFGAVMLVGLGGLGYLAYSSSGTLAAATENYESKKQALATLHGVVPYPKVENQKKVEAERDKVIAAYRDLQKSLSATKVPLNDLSASAFQQELKRTVDAVLEKADKAGVSRLKDGDNKDKRQDSTSFDLGFNYLNQLPEGDAAKPLGRQLKVIEWVVNMMIDNKVVGLPELKRTPIPAEKVGGKAKEDDKDKKGAKGTSKDTSPALISSTSFTITFKANQESASRVLSEIAACKEQFLVTRKLSIVNTSPNPPVKAPVAVALPAGGSGEINPETGQPIAAAPAATPAAPAPAAAAGTKDNSKLTFLIGEEMVEVEAEIEILDITQPAEPTNATTKKP